MSSRLVVVGLVILVGTLGLAVIPAQANAAPQCRERVISDWSDNGRVDRIYPLTCYEAAIDSMPPDLRDYTDAHEMITRALTLAVRTRSGAKPNAAAQAQTPPVAAPAVAAADTSAPASLPAALFVLGGITLTMLVAGGVGYLGRRAKPGRDGPGR